MSLGNSKEADAKYAPCLDITSEAFDPWEMLRTDNDFKVFEKIIKIRYENLASLESALKKYGLLQLGKSKKTLSGEDASTSSKAIAIRKEQVKAFEEIRNRLLLQMNPELKAPVAKTPKRHLRSLEIQMTNVVGPLSLLERCVKEKLRCCVRLHNAIIMNASLEGQLIYFDKYLNLLLINVEEKKRRRKMKYGPNMTVGEPENCSERLRKLGITLPASKARSLDRKNVELTTYISQLLVRGDQVALISICPNSEHQLLNKNTQ